MRALLHILAFLVMAGASQAISADSADLVQGVTTPIYLPITLPNLVRGSVRIFLGRIRAVRVLPKINAECEVDFDVTEWLRKEGGANPKQVTLRVHASTWQPLNPGDRVLWFLPRDGADGISTPLGRTSGDFRVDERDYATSLNANRGLWADDGSLWESSSDCSRERFLEILRNRRTNGSTLLAYLRIADNPYRQQPLPLRFLSAAVLSCLPPAELADAERDRLDEMASLER